MTSGWKGKPLGDLCRVLGGGTPSKENPAYYAGSIPWATVRDMNSDALSQTEFKITEAALKDSSTNVIPKGNVVIASRVGLGKVCFLEQDTAINQDLRGIVPYDPRVLSPRYLFWWLKSIAHLIVAEGTGATVQGVKLPFIKALPVRFPPVSEQERIAGILDEALNGVSVAKSNADANSLNAQELLSRHLDAVFERKGKNWITAPLSALCDIKHGFAFSSEFFVKGEGDYVLLTPGNFLEKGGYRDRGVKQKYYTGEIPDGFTLSPGDLLVAMTEQAPGLLGSPILVPGTGTFLHNQRLGLVTPKADVAWANEFFFHVFNQKAVRQAIYAGASGVKVRHTSPTKIGLVTVSYPAALGEQRALAANLDEVRDQVERLHETYGKKRAALEDLAEALLHKAVNGGL